MTLLLHPTGNTFVRETIRSLEEIGSLESFHTTVGISSYISNRNPLEKLFERRSYDIKSNKLKTYPYRESARLIFNKLNFNHLIRHEKLFSIDNVSLNLSKKVAHYIERNSNDERIKNVYGYEDSALSAFEAASKHDIRCIYELPIAYWKHMHDLLAQEMELRPEWGPTLVFDQDSSEKLERKERELELADTIVCPSDFVYDSLPNSIRNNKNCIINKYGAPEAVLPPLVNNSAKKIKFLFVGSMSQRKGLADLLEAFNEIKRPDVELTIIGSPLMPMSFYYSIYPHFKHIRSVSNSEVLEVMRSCDVFVLPSIVEGRALVQLEAISMGLPLIITPNTGGCDLVEDGKTGFIVPIRSSRAIMQKVNWFADNKNILYDMKKYVQDYARRLGWKDFRDGIRKIVE